MKFPLEPDIFWQIPEVGYDIPSNRKLKRLYGSNYLKAKFLYERLVLRTRLSEAQNHRCAYCYRVTNTTKNSRLQATVEHVLPRSRGGRDIYEHCVMACGSCNHKRGNRYNECERYVLGELQAESSDADGMEPLSVLQTDSGRQSENVV